MNNLDKIKNAKSGISIAKMLAFKVAQELHGNLNDLRSFTEFEQFHETKNKFEKIFSSWLSEES